MSKYPPKETLILLSTLAAAGVLIIFCFYLIVSDEDFLVPGYLKTDFLTNAIDVTRIKRNALRTVISSTQESQTTNSEMQAAIQEVISQLKTQVAMYTTILRVFATLLGQDKYNRKAAFSEIMANEHCHELFYHALSNFKQPVDTPRCPKNNCQHHLKSLKIP